ncbi:MAG TPA: primosomal protein N' [Candidatus Limnocylindria bacterium]|nr:primosomal protein N' [Candidatus Limnocylindria bacterium]
MPYFYFEVLVSSQRYHSAKLLTYRHESPLRPGTPVIVPLQRQTVVAVVIRKASKPTFTSKDILGVISTRTVPAELLALIAWLKEYYPAPSGQIASLALPGILSSKSRQSQTRQAASQLPTPLPPLTKNQAQALRQIQEQHPKSILLHGDTGTGKTRLYIELARQALGKRLSVILLTPEIGLTPQLATSLQEAFPDQTLVMHSELSSTARRNGWMRSLESDKPLVIIGPRSALFTPVHKVGFIILDEFHEPSYKQEQAPHYLATRVAAKLAELHQAQLILGSATPLVGDYYAFKEKGLPVIRMQQQAMQSNFGQKPIVSIVDLKDKQHFGRSPWISDTLIDSIEKSLASKQQSLIFLNRRGTARLALCQACGWQALCPNCDLPLTYHGDFHTMVCHTCGYQQKTLSSCPDCSSDDIVFRSIGTKFIVAEIERLLPSARVKRFDSDTHKTERLDQQYTAVRQGSADVLVGTQMLGKGLDLPKLSVVGIVTAEASLFFPDYTAEERTYQLITQALGRVHRGHIPGTAVIQTYHPESPLLRAAVTKDYEAFYDQQIIERKRYGFPPFKYVLKLMCTRASSTAAQQASQRLAEKLRTSHLPVEVIGPNPAFVEKSHGKYHWQIIIKSARRPVLVDIIKDLPANWSYDVDPISLL